MTKYRVTIDHQATRYVPDPNSEGVASTVPEHTWENDALLEGDEKLIAGALRAQADKIDPPKPHTRGGGDY